MKMVRKQKLVVKIITISLICVIATAVILTVIGAREIDEAYSSMTRETLHNAAATISDEFENAFEGDWVMESDGTVHKGDLNLSEDYSIIDNLKEGTGLEYTLFWADTRVATTIYKEGSTTDRNVGTQAPEGVWNQVKSGQEVYGTKFYVAGNPYNGYYVPLSNSDGTIVGMAYAGRDISDINAKISKAIFTMIIVAAVIVAVILIIGIRIAVT